VLYWDITIPFTWSHLLLSYALPGIVYFQCHVKIFSIKFCLFLSVTKFHANIIFKVRKLQAFRIKLQVLVSCLFLWQWLYLPAAKTCVHKSNSYFNDFFVLIFFPLHENKQTSFFDFKTHPSMEEDLDIDTIYKYRFFLVWILHTLWLDFEWEPTFFFFHGHQDFKLQIIFVVFTNDPIKYSWGYSIFTWFSLKVLNMSQLLTEQLIFQAWLETLLIPLYISHNEFN